MEIPVKDPVNAAMDSGKVPYVIRKATGQRLPTFNEVLSKLNIENHSELEDSEILRVIKEGLYYMMKETKADIVYLVADFNRTLH